MTAIKCTHSSCLIVLPIIVANCLGNWTDISLNLLTQTLHCTVGHQKSSETQCNWGLLKILIGRGHSELPRTTNTLLNTCESVEFKLKSWMLYTLYCQKYSLTPSNNWNQVFQSLPWPQVYKSKHLSMQTVSTNICERMGRSQELSEFQRSTVIGCHLGNKSKHEISSILNNPQSTVNYLWYYVV